MANIGDIMENQGKEIDPIVNELSLKRDLSVDTIEEILRARSIAVVGASAKRGFGGWLFIAGLLGFGFKGKIYPVNPKHSEIEGLKAYPTLRSIPDPVDYVISSVPAEEVRKRGESGSPFYGSVQ
jgi:predicted CoA-binding protein